MSAKPNALQRRQWKQGGKADCPTCNAAQVRFIYRPHLNGYHLAMRCPRGCGDNAVPHTEDPERGTFREFTPEEAELIYDRHFANKPICCPVDGARVHVLERPHSQGNLIRAHCERCWKEVQKNFANAPA